MFVPPQAMCALRPSPKIGSPAGISPTASSEGERTPARIQRLGRVTPRCGSAASIAPPPALRDGATTTLLLPDRLNPSSNPASTACRSPAAKLVIPMLLACSARCQITGQSGRVRSPARPKYVVQLMSVPATRPIAMRSRTVQVSRRNPSSRYSGGRRRTRSW